MKNLSHRLTSNISKFIFYGSHENAEPVDAVEAFKAEREAAITAASEALSAGRENMTEMEEAAIMAVVDEEVWGGEERGRVKVALEGLLDGTPSDPSGSAYRQHLIMELQAAADEHGRSVNRGTEFTAFMADVEGLTTYNDFMSTRGEDDFFAAEAGTVRNAALSGREAAEDTGRELAAQQAAEEAVDAEAALDEMIAINEPLGDGGQAAELLAAEAAADEMMAINDPLGDGGQAAEVLAAQADVDNMMAINNPLGEGGTVEAQQAADAAALAEQYAELGVGAATRFGSIDFQGMNDWTTSTAEQTLMDNMNQAFTDKMTAEVPAALLGTDLAQNYAAQVLAEADTSISRHEKNNNYQGVEVETHGDEILASIEGAQSFDEFTLLAMANDEIPPSEMLVAVDQLSGDARDAAESIVANRIMRAEAGTDLNFTRQWAQALESAGHPSAVAVAEVDTQLTTDTRSAEYEAERDLDTAGIAEARAQLAAQQAAAEEGLEAFGGSGDEEGIGDVVLTSAEAGTDDITSLDLSLSGKQLDLTAPLSVDPDMVTSGLNVRQAGQTNAAFTLTPGSELTFNGGQAQTGRELGFASNVHDMQFISVTDERGRTGYVAADYVRN